MNSNTSGFKNITPEDGKFMLSPEDEFNEKISINKENVSPFEEQTPHKLISQASTNSERAPLGDISIFFLQDSFKVK